jgi:hypothetical protein
MMAVVHLNIHYMLSYRWDGTPTREPTDARQKLESFFEKTHANECKILSQILIEGLAFGFIVQKYS